MEMIAVIGELKYGSYEFNRDHAPEIPAKKWKGIYGEDVEWMEERYQEEKAKAEQDETNKLPAAKTTQVVT